MKSVWEIGIGKSELGIGFSKRTVFHFPIALLALFALASCQDALFDPFDNEERYFTVFGYLDQLETNHQLRVIPISRVPERIESPSDPQALLDAEVTTTNLTTGHTIHWIHHLERLTDGTYGHIFRASFTVEPGHTYRLEVRRVDGVMTTAEVRVPPLGSGPAPRLGPVEGTNLLTQEVLLPRIASPWNVRVRYHIPIGIDLLRIPIDYGRPGERTTDGNWRFAINLSDDAQQVHEYLGENFPDTPRFTLAEMSLLVRVLDENWDPPGGVFEPEILAQPGTFSNVEKGYGFFGAIGVYFSEWPVSRELAHALGFQ